MKIFQYLLGLINDITQKKGMVLMLFFFFSINITAQIALRIEPGVLLGTDSEDLGLMLNAEPKINNSENTVIGLRFGIATNPQKFRIEDTAPFFIDDSNDNVMLSFVPTLDYYLSENYHRPYVGFGIGYYVLSSVDILDRNGSFGSVEANVKNQLGILLRGGIELGVTRFGLEYNFIPETDIEIARGETVGTVKNNYFGLSVGFSIGNR